MGNCLITQLKESVQNDTLLKLGSMWLHVNQTTIPSGQESNMQKLHIKNNDTIKLIVHGNGHIASSLAELSSNPKTVLELVAGEWDIYFENATYNVEVTNKYAIYTLRTAYSVGIITGDVDNLKYNTELIGLLLYGDWIGDVEILPASVTSLLLYNTKIRGNINSLNGRNLNGTSSLSLNLNPNIIGDIFAVNPNITEYECQESRGLYGDVSELIGTSVIRIFGTDSGITGSMKDLGKVATLNSISLDGCKLTSGGRIEDFVASRRGAGQTTGSVRIAVAGMGITFNGSTDNVNYNTTALSWTASTITYGDLTVDNSEVYND